MLDALMEYESGNDEFLCELCEEYGVIMPEGTKESHRLAALKRHLCSVLGRTLPPALPDGACCMAETRSCCYPSNSCQEEHKERDITMVAALPRTGRDPKVIHLKQSSKRWSRAKGAVRMSTLMKARRTTMAR